MVTAFQILTEGRQKEVSMASVASFWLIEFPFHLITIISIFSRKWLNVAYLLYAHNLTPKSLRTPRHESQLKMFPI